MDYHGGSTLIITGGETAIGIACARRLARMFGAITLSYRSDHAAAERLCAAIRASGARALAVAGDVGEPDAVEALFAASEARFGVTRALVNAASTDLRGPQIADLSIAHFVRTVRADLYAPFLTCRRFARALAPCGALGAVGAGARGGIVNVSALHEISVERGSASQLNATLARELAPLGIALHGIALGRIGAPTPAALFGGGVVLPGRGDPPVAVGQETPADIAERIAVLLAPQVVGPAMAQRAAIAAPPAAAIAAETADAGLAG
ncbi:SDR family NAD(P)-dependent oxidoreductase [Sphingomonas sp. RB3P16]|uniref:SDR family NAD(P)-dependent oxidoreductase n=1 Tax=Parasphingomonas frigoris TaxID=3096163 RepID=UPI002FC6EC73